MPPIYVGGTEIDDLAVGGTEVNEVYVGSNKIWERVTQVQATGGTITDVGGFRYHTFLASGTFTILSGDATFNALCQAGGGQVGTGGGAGGAAIFNGPMAVQAYAVTVGVAANGQVGGNSAIAGIASSTGGSNVSADPPAYVGAASGSGNTGGPFTGGTGVPSFLPYIASGFGGAGGSAAVGGNASTSGYNCTGGAGGAGYVWLDGVRRGGGGGGRAYNSIQPGGTGIDGAGGAGGGGTGTVPAAANTGSGASGFSAAAAGVVIIRYPYAPATTQLAIVFAGDATDSETFEVFRTAWVLGVDDADSIGLEYNDGSGWVEIPAVGERVFRVPHTILGNQFRAVATFVDGNPDVVSAAQVENP